jgi:hypothetical protein
MPVSSAQFNPNAQFSSPQKLPPTYLALESVQVDGCKRLRLAAKPAAARSGLSAIFLNLNRLPKGMQALQEVMWLQAAGR